MVKLGIIGVTGLVGEEVLTILEQHNYKYESLRIFASSKSVDCSYTVSNTEYLVEELNNNSFTDLDVAIFCVSSKLALEYAPIANNHDCIVIDNSSAYRMDKTVPLIVPEINRDLIQLHRGIIANPNCSSILLAVATYPLHQLNPIKKMIVSTYQAASGAGINGLTELEEQTYKYATGDGSLKTHVFGRQLLYNAFSHNSDINLETGYNEEEHKMINEIPKIFGTNDISVTVTCVRIPVKRSHCESVYITFRDASSCDKIRMILNGSDGITLMDDRINNQFPEPLITSNKDNVFVGRIRRDISDDTNRSFHIFLSGDQLRKGAALNALQIYSKLLIY
jgi:aspartate-semialdehyde dehydrogenase